MKVLAIAAVVAAAWWVTDLRPFTVSSTVAVVGAGVAAMAAGRRRGPHPVARVDVGDVLPWLVLVAVLAAWQSMAFVQHPRSEHPTLSSLANALLDTHATRVLGFLAWLVGGARLARR
jgi:hypothetical protein